MFQKQSIAGRVFIGKGAGFVLGGLAFFVLPVLGAETSSAFGLGVWLMTILMGVMIGFIGVFHVHPLLGFRMPFYVRGAIVGASFFMLLPLLAMGDMTSLMELNIVQAFGLNSVWWVVAEGAIWGVLLAGMVTAIAGEGDLPVQ